MTTATPEAFSHTSPTPAQGRPSQEPGPGEWKRGGEMPTGEERTGRRARAARKKGKAAQVGTKKLRAEEREKRDRKSVV